MGTMRQYQIAVLKAEIAALEQEIECAESNLKTDMLRLKCRLKVLRLEEMQDTEMGELLRLPREGAFLLTPGERVLSPRSVNGRFNGFKNTGSYFKAFIARVRSYFRSGSA